MKRKFLVVALASAVLAWSASAQTSASSQTSAAGSSQTSITANDSGAQANSNTSVNASQSGQTTHSNHEKSNGSQSSASATGAASNSAPAGAGSGTASLASGTTMNAVLSKTVDARHAKPGDEVTAKVTQDVKSDGKVVVPKNSKLIGHVTEAKAKEKGDANAQSSLGIVFDHALLKNGEQVPMHVAIQALAAAQNNAAASAAPDQPLGAGAPTASGGARSGGGALGGVGSTVGTTAGAAGSAAGDLGQTAGGVVNSGAGVAGSAAGNAGGALGTTGQLTSRSTGVIGLSGLQLASQATNATQGSVITSSSKTVKLDSGTQMLLRVTNE